MMRLVMPSAGGGAEGGASGEQEQSNGDGWEEWVGGRVIYYHTCVLIITISR